jgi:hypothetical protein
MHFLVLPIRDKMHTVWVFWMNLALFAAVVTVVSGFVMLSWNYAVPRLAQSVDPTYDISKFRNITYPTALVLMLIGVFLFSDWPSKYYDPNSREFYELQGTIPSLVEPLPMSRRSTKSKN